MEWWKILICTVLYAGIGYLALYNGARQLMKCTKALEERFGNSAAWEYEQALQVYTLKNRAQVWITFALIMAVWPIVVPLWNMHIARQFTKEWKWQEELESWTRTFDVRKHIENVYNITTL